MGMINFPTLLLLDFLLSTYLSYHKLNLNSSLGTRKKGYEWYKVFFEEKWSKVAILRKES
jgi:hypothetical protein